MATRKKSTAKKATSKKTPSKLKPIVPKRVSAPDLAAGISRIEKMVKRTFDIVEFLEAEIIKARDAQDGPKKIEPTPYDETT